MFENKVIVKNDLQPFELVMNNTDVNGTASTQIITWTNPNSIVRQTSAPQDLDVVSWPKDVKMPFWSKMPGYDFDTSYGVGTFIYIIDNGIEPNDPVKPEAVGKAIEIIVDF